MHFRDMFMHKMFCPVQPRVQRYSVMNMNPFEAMEEALESRVARRLKDVDNCAPLVARSDTQCCICLEEMPPMARRTPCKHEFCAKCIETWLDLNTTCPVCKKDFGDEFGYVLIDTQTMKEVNAEDTDSDSSDNNILQTMNYHMEMMIAILGRSIR